MHTNQISLINPIFVHHGENVDRDLTQSYDFVIPDNQGGIVTMVLAKSVSSDIRIFCGTSIDVQVRLIILFPQVAQIQVTVTMCGDDSAIKILSLCALSQQQSVTMTTRQIHCGKKSSSKLILQGLLSEQASLTYDGTIRIEKDASGTYALQNNKNILLSSKASAISIPNIEVLNHDVQCYHGAAIGKFDIAQMYYMKSRGLNEVIIKQLLVQELFAEVLEGYEHKDTILATVYENIGCL